MLSLFFLTVFVQSWVGIQSQEPIFNIDCCPAITNNPDRSFLISKDHALAIDPNYVRDYPIPPGATTNEFAAMDDYFNYLASLDAPYGDLFQPDFDTLKQFEREVFQLVLIKLGSAGDAPLRTFVRYYRTDDLDAKGDRFQHDIAMVAFANAECGYGGDNIVGEGTGIDTIQVNSDFKEDPFRRTYDAVAFIDECVGNDATDCEGDVHAWSNEIDFSFDAVLSEKDKAELPNFDEWSTYPGVFLNADGGLAALNPALCNEIGRYHSNFCDFYAGSDVRVLFIRQRQRYGEMFADLYTDSDAKKPYGQSKIVFVTRYDVTQSEDAWNAGQMPDRPGPMSRIRLREFWLKSFDESSEESSEDNPKYPDYIEAQKLLGDIVNFVTEDADPYLDRRAC